MKDNQIFSNETVLHELDKNGTSQLVSLNAGIDLVTWINPDKALVVISATFANDIDYLKRLQNGATLQLCASKGLPLDHPDLKPLMRFGDCQIKQWFFSKPRSMYFASEPVRLSVVLTCKLELFTNGR